ncbi:MAG: DctP family TRAP transporter solute-binding subunit [Alphaproteobacteria bacterium]|nr:DctP family TRAP transporter solute-binding subunit [Alphaproteobacteria bacterium]
MFARYKTINTIKYTFIALSVSMVSLMAPNAMASCDAGEMVIKFSHVTNADRHPKGIAAKLLQQRVNDEMNGTACMEVYPNSTLYGDSAALDALLSGDLQLAAPALSLFERFTKRFRIFDLPFMFKNIEAVDIFQASKNGQALKDIMKNEGLQGLEFWHNGMKQISAKVPITLPINAKGLKFRVQSSDVLVAQIEAIGASPQKLTFSEVYDALKNGIVDGQENTWSNIYGQKFYQVQDGITESNHGVLDYLVVTSITWLDSLNPETRQQFLQILKEVTETRNAESAKINQQNKQLIVDSGGTVRTLNDKKRTAWLRAMRPVWKKFEKDVGKDNIRAIQEINSNL